LRPVAHTTNPSTWEREAERSRKIEVSLGYIARPVLKQILNKQKIETTKIQQKKPSLSVWK
jgi:hypothetical protein